MKSLPQKHCMLTANKTAKVWTRISRVCGEASTVLNLLASHRRLMNGRNRGPLLRAMISLITRGRRRCICDFPPPINFPRGQRLTGNGSGPLDLSLWRPCPGFVVRAGIRLSEGSSRISAEVWIALLECILMHISRWSSCHPQVLLKATICRCVPSW